MKKRIMYGLLSESQKQKVNTELVSKEVWDGVSSEVEYILKQEDRNAPYSLEDVENLYFTFKEARDDGMIPNDMNQEDYDPIMKEVFEYWKVSRWLIEKLNTFCEPVIQDYNIWGRCTTGQSIAIDGVIYQIAEDLWNEGYYFNDSNYDFTFYEEVK